MCEEEICKQWAYLYLRENSLSGPALEALAGVWPFLNGLEIIEDKP